MLQKSACRTYRDYKRIKGVICIKNSRTRRGLEQRITRKKG